MNDLGDGIIQPPTENDNYKLKKMKKIYEDSSKKLEFYNQEEDIMKLGSDMQRLEKNWKNKNE